MLSIAQAAKNSGGTVIAQVKRIVDKGQINPRLVKIPGIFVDALVIDPAQKQTYQIDYDPTLCGEKQDGSLSMENLPFDERKVIVKRAALELYPNAVVNLGFGMPFGVGQIAEESGVADQITLSIEQGSLGGIPAGGLDSGAMYYPTAILDQPYQFDSYQGSGIDIAFLSHAQVDQHGNVNVSKFGNRIPGCGGFIDISQNAKKVVFCGTLSVKPKLEIQDGALKILKEGKAAKFVNLVEQITFSGKYASATGQEVLFITERAVFQLIDGNVVLKETAPGIDIENDILGAMEFKPLIQQVSKMDKKVFTNLPINLPQFTST